MHEVKEDKHHLDEEEKKKIERAKALL